MSKVVPPVLDKDKSRRAGHDGLDRPLVKRFYKDVTFSETEGVFCVELDGRPVRTPSRSPLALACQPLVGRICDEWRGQVDWIDPDSMPLTKLANTAIDGVTEQMDEVRQAVLAFAGSDLLCYRVDAPRELAQKQAEAWDPVLDWIGTRFGARFEIGIGVGYVDQSRKNIDALADYLGGKSAFELTPLHVMTSLTGSLFLALAVAEHRFDVAQAWDVAHIDEDWQAAQWGEDGEAQNRRDRRSEEFRAATEFLRLLKE